jgi:hypothetical protein
MRLMARILVCLGALLSLAGGARADGCYLCAGGETYVRFRGEDSWHKRRGAEACGCAVVASVRRCPEARRKRELCEVATDLPPR